MDQKSQQEGKNSQNIQQFCTFRISGRLFGLNILDVQEVNSVLAFTSIAHAPKAVRGYINIRGQIHLVIDLRVLLGFEQQTDFEDHRIVIFKPSVSEASGVLVDKIGDVVEMDVNEIEDRRKRSGDGYQGPERRQGASAALSAGVCKLKDELLVILDSERISTHIKADERQI